MANAVLKKQRANPQDLKKLISSNEDYKIGLRLYLVYLVSLGNSSRKLAEFHDISFKQITNWVHRFEKEGIEGLKDKEGRGRRSVLTEEQLNQIKKIVLEDIPENHGFNEPRWNGPLLAKWI